MIWIEILMVLGAIVAGFYYLGNRLTLNASKKIGTIVQELDHTYSSALEAKLLVSNQNMHNEIQILVDELFVLIKPQVDSLIFYINSVSLSDIHSNYSSFYFSNVLSLAESYCTRRHQNSSYFVTDKDEEKMYQVLKEAIIADLNKRLIRNKISDL